MNFNWVAEPLRQAVPHNAGPVTVEHGIDEQLIVVCGHADQTGTARHQVLDLLPLIVFVAKYDACARRVLQEMAAL